MVVWTLQRIIIIKTELNNLKTIVGNGQWLNEAEMREDLSLKDCNYNRMKCEFLNVCIMTFLNSLHLLWYKPEDISAQGGWLESKASRAARNLGKKSQKKRPIEKVRNKMWIYTLSKSLAVHQITHGGQQGAQK